MPFRTFLWTIFRRALHGTWGWVEKAEVLLATLIYALSFFFHGIKEYLGVAFLVDPEGYSGVVWESQNVAPGEFIDLRLEG